MGRELPTGFVTRQAAAETLGVSLDTVHNFVRRGILRAHTLPGIRGPLFRREEVEAAAADKVPKSPSELKGLVLAALSAARRAEQRLDELYSELGLDTVPLDRSEAGVRALYAEARLPVLETDLRTPGWLRRWGGIFFALDEHYLELVQHVTGDAEPWKVFTDLATAVSRRVLHEQDDLLRRAAARFQAGQRHLYYVGYMYCRRTQSVHVANVVFDGKAPAVDELLALLG